MIHSFKYIVLIVIYILLSSYISLIYAFTEQEIVQLNNIFGQIINIINETRVSLENKNNELKELMIEGFRSNHFFGRSKVKILKNSTGQIVSPCNDHSTYHTVHYDGYVTALFNPHMLCHPFENIILHEYYDLGILLDPKYLLPYAIDINVGASPELGDDVIAYGHGGRAKVWGGKISDFSEEKCDEPAKHFNGTTRICAGEWIVQGHQHEGMSGSAVANGCGYLGIADTIAHALKNSKFLNSVDANFAGVIGVKIIRQFISANKHVLAKHDNTSIIVNELPFAPFAECIDSMEVEIN